MDHAIQAAIREAHKTPPHMNYRHGAVLLSRGKVVASGYNYTLLTREVFSTRPHPGFHAEECCLASARARRVWGDTILVVRVNPRNELRLSRPCKRCLGLLRRKGVRRVLFSNDQGGIESLLL